MKLELHSVTFFSISKLRQNSTILLRFLLQFKYKYPHLKTKAKNLPKTNNLCISSLLLKKKKKLRTIPFQNIKQTKTQEEPNPTKTNHDLKKNKQQIKEKISK